MKPIEAIQGVPNACAPLPHLVTGGQPTPAHLAQLKEAGIGLVLDIRDPAEPRGFDEPATLQTLGIPYRNIVVNAGTMTSETLEQITGVLRAHKDQEVFFHCGSGARVGAAMLPYLVLDQGMSREEAVQVSINIGLRAPEMLHWGFAYLDQQDKA
jgi:protein tyrosine phosphatase (PTP) superfamily phosphohydrolase (DUF442 family)